MKKIFASLFAHKIVTGVALILVLFGGYYFFFRGSAQTTALQYVTTKAEKGTLTTAISGSGNVIVDQLATVDPTISGTVANLSVNVGDAVKKGQLLFTITNNDLSVSSAKATASLQQSQNLLSSAKLQVTQAKDD